MLTYRVFTHEKGPEIEITLRTKVWQAIAGAVGAVLVLVLLIIF